MRGCEFGAIGVLMCFSMVVTRGICCINKPGPEPFVSSGSGYNSIFICDRMTPT